MFCSKCGANNADGVAFCNSCGAPLPVQPEAPVQPATPVQPAAPVQPQKPKNNKGLIIGIVAGVVALIAIIAVICFFVFRDKDDNDSDDKSNKTKVEDTVKDDENSKNSDKNNDKNSDKNSNKNNDNNDNTNGGNSVTVDPKHDSKVVGKWKMVMEEDLGNGDVLQMVAYMEFKADGTCKGYFNENELRKSMTDALYSSMSSELGGSYTNAEIDQLLAESGQPSVAEMVDEFIAEFAEEGFEFEGYWETDNGTIVSWEADQTKDEEVPSNYTVSADGKTLEIEDVGILMERV